MRSALESFSSFSSSFLSVFFYPCELLILCLSVLIHLRLLLLSALSGFSRPDRRFRPQSSAPPLCAYPTAALSCSPFLAFPSRRIPGESLLFGTKALQALKRAERPNRSIQATREHRWEVRGQRKINSALSCGGLLPPRVRLSKASPSTAGLEHWCVFTNWMPKKMMTAV